MNKIDRVTITAYYKGDYRISFYRPSDVHSYWITGRKVAQSSLLMRVLETKGVPKHPYYAKHFISNTYLILNLTPQEKAMEAMATLNQWLKDGAPGNTEEPWYYELEENKPEAAKHQVARKMAKAILNAADVDGLGGCLLCRS